MKAPKPGECILAKDRLELLEDPYGWTTAIYKGPARKGFETTTRLYHYGIRLKDFKPDDMEATKERIFCSRCGRIVPLKSD